MQTLAESQYDAIIEIVLHFRTRQVEFLTMVADRNDATFTQAFVGVVKEAMERDGTNLLPVAQPTQKIRKHIHIPMEILTYIDSLVAKHGLERSDIARRLIDGAQARYNAWGKR